VDYLQRTNPQMADGVIDLAAHFRPGISITNSRRQVTLSMEGIPPPKFQPTPLQATFMRLIASYKEMQLDYHKVGFINPTIWGNSCRALDEAEKKLTDILTKLHEGEYIEDWQKHLGHED
jgi:hypothetical protein